MRKETPLQEIPRSERQRLIDEWITRENYRAILKDRLLNGMTYGELADKYGYSERHLKTIVYKCEDQIFKHMR